RALFGSMDAHDAALDLAAVERNSLNANDALEPHGLSAAELDALVDQLRENPGVQGAWLVRKALKQFADEPLHLFTGDWKGPAYRLTNPAKVMNELAEKIKFSGQTIVLVGREVVWSLQKKIRKFPSSQIFAR